MPVFNFYQWSESHGYTLTASGPLISVEISIPAALKVYLSEKGLPVPAPQSGFALIDTGAFATAVDQSVFDALGIAPIDKIQTSTPHGAAESPVYPATVTFPGLALTEMPMERVIGCNLKWKTAEGKEILMLLGRDLLQYFLLVYNGKSADIFLAY
jgi:predicted aspartyl protease